MAKLELDTPSRTGTWRCALLASTLVLGACVTESRGETETAGSEQAVLAKAAAPYPIVLAHGFFGFEDFAGLSFVQYYWHVKDHLASLGEPQVFTPAVDPFNDSTLRGKQLLARVEEIVRTTGAAKVNLIGHSQGGLDARYVAHVRPDLVASVVTVATPHEGLPVSDAAFGLLGHPVASSLLDSLVRILGGPLWDEVGNETSLASSFRQFTTPSMNTFNTTYTDVPTIPYFSIAGRTALSLGGEDCASDDTPSWISRWDDVRDTTEPLFIPLEIFTAGIHRRPNDGLVPVASARHGLFLGCIPADHLDQIGHLFGGSPGLGNHWSHLDFYADLVRFLRARGL